MPSDKGPPRAKPDYSSLVPAVEQASRILLALAQNRSRGMTLTEICNEVGIHKSKGYSILNTLQHFAFVRRSPESKTYSLGPGLLFLSGKALNHLDVREAVTPVLQELSHKTDSTAFFGLVSGRHVFVVATDEGHQDIGLTIRLGHRFPLAWGAHGKAIVAFLSEPERQQVLETHKPYFHGNPSRFDLHRFEEELAECRRSGFAVDLGEMKSGVHAVASPVFGPSGNPIGALAVVGTFPRHAAKRHGVEIAVAARKFSEMIGGVPRESVSQDGT